MDRLELVRSAYDAWNDGDDAALLAIADSEIEIAPLVIGVTSVGPWQGHDGVRRLLADARKHWARFDVRCDDLIAVDERVVALVHVETTVAEGAPVISGDIAHVVEVRDGLVTRFTAFRDRSEAIAAAQA